MTAIPTLEPIHLVLIAPQMISWGLQQLVQSAGTCFALGGVASNLESAPQALLLPIAGCRNLAMKMWVPPSMPRWNTLTNSPTILFF